MTSRFRIAVGLLATVLLVLPLASRAQDGKTAAKPASAEKPAEPAPPADVTTQGEVSVGGRQIAYNAVAGTITVGATDEQDAQLGLDGKPLPGSQLALSAPKEPADAPAIARMFYVAYCQKDVKAEDRPITFFYNGGPGSSTVWLHMGSLGPKHVVTDTDQHMPAAPYKLADNPDTLLDVSDLVFVDAPGTGFGRLLGKDAPKVVLGRGSGRECLCPLHGAIHQQVQPLELAQVYLRRELRNHALRGAGQSAGGEPRNRFERRDPALADFQLQRVY